MDASVLSIVPTGGVAAVLVAVIFYLLRQNHADRAQYGDHITRAEAAHAGQMDRVEAQLAELNEKLSATLADLEAERRLRWHAEDVAAKARRDLAAIEGDRT